MSGSAHAASRPRVDVVVVSYNQRDRLLAGLASVASEPSTRLIVVDNDSGDGSAQAVAAAHPETTLIALEENIGFGPAVNRGVAAGDAPLVLLLNNDARMESGALASLVAALDDERVAAAGPRLVGADGQVELSLDRTLSPWNEAYFKILGGLYRDGRGPAAGHVERRYALSRDVGSLSGACVLLRRAAYEQVGGFDERFFLYAEDVDLCLRLRHAGWRLRYVAEAVVAHDRGASRATAPSITALHYRRSQIAFYRKHRGVLATRLLRLYLAFRFAVGRIFARSEDQRRLAADLLRSTLRQPDK